jgi:mannose-6-phosphate isomerase-like protein (cupin superfamily)
MQKTDYGPGAFAVDVAKAAILNENYRTALWSGKHLQLTLMSVNQGDDIGVELHPATDQILLIIEGSAVGLMGYRKDHLSWQQPLYPGSCLFVPAGTWHNVVNCGKAPLKIASIYGPPNHPYGTIHETKEVAEREEHN